MHGYGIAPQIGLTHRESDRKMRACTQRGSITISSFKSFASKPKDRHRKLHIACAQATNAWID